jgi:aspartyl-tRNA(Asn)/glutamyl-tRNA(Gln) amidotransferase subunit C
METAPPGGAVGRPHPAFNQFAAVGGAPRMATMPIARDDVAHLARLSRLALADEELDHLAAQLEEIISAVERVQEVAAEGIPPTSHAVPLVNVFRDDVERPCLTPEQALDQAPAVEQQRFRVPRILAED